MILIYWTILWWTRRNQLKPLLGGFSFLDFPESPHGAEQVPNPARETEQKERAEGGAKRGRRARRRVSVSCSAFARAQPRARLQPQ